ncbi:MAG TPA: trypsin-like peptidase domain-containing protein [Candidatus Dormibacteraeota bacterium]|nr:trypsin-like peptidase domain-containing protein [Candidatus Dormibacteraeota bacterium]
MVAHQYFESPSQSAAPAAPPTTPPPKRSFRRGFLVALAAVTVASGAGAGAAAAALIGHGAATASASTALPTNLTSTGSASTTATAVYALDSPGVVTITVNLGNGQAIGSGIVLDTKGDILTNAHVLSGAQQIQVAFSDGTTATGTLVGSNTSADLAVIRVSVAASTLHPLTLGSSASVKVGDTVFAIGSPFGLSGSLTEGIVSNLSQSGSAAGSSLIQTDAAINPGNSGGPLVNAQGQVIGINNSIESPVDGNVGVGFAIPIDQVKLILPSIDGGVSL